MIKRIQEYSQHLEKFDVIRRLAKNIFKLSDRFKELTNGFNDMDSDFESLDLSSKDLKKRVSSFYETVNEMSTLIKNLNESLNDSEQLMSDE